MIEFNFSESVIKKRKRFLMVIPFIVFFIGEFSLFTMEFKISRMFLIGSFGCGIAFLMLLIIFYIEIRLLPKRYNKIKFQVYEDKIVKHYGKIQQTILWNNIIKMKIIKDAKGSIISIWLFEKNKKVIYLNGFNEMDKIANLIKEKITDSVLLQTKYNRIDIENPATFILIAIVFVVIIFILRNYLEIFGTFVLPFIFLFLGFVFLIFKPMTKIDLRSKWFEIIIGLYFIIVGIGGIYNIICDLF